MKIRYFYDVLCPYSWLGYQMIRQKLPIWKTHRNVEIEYIPFAIPFVHNRVASFGYFDRTVAEKQYKVKELNEIADCYGFEKGNFEVVYSPNIRNRSTLLLLNHLRSINPSLHIQFMENIWRRIFIDCLTANGVDDFLKIFRQLGVSYSETTEIILKIENRNNVLDLDDITHKLVDEKIIGSPWIKVESDELNVAFFNILRLELLGEIIRDPLLIPHSNKLERISAM